MGRLGKAMERLDRMMEEGAVLDWVDRPDAMVVTTADGNSHTWSARDVLLVWIGYVMGKKVARDEVEQLDTGTNPGTAAFVTGRAAGKRHRQLVALRRAIDIGEHAHDLGDDYSKCWNGDDRCPVWRTQGGDVHARP